MLQFWKRNILHRVLCFITGSLASGDVLEGSGTLGRYCLAKVSQWEWVLRIKNQVSLTVCLSLLTAEAMGLATSCPFSHTFLALIDYLSSRTICLFNLETRISPGHKHEKNHSRQSIYSVQWFNVPSLLTNLKSCMPKIKWLLVWTYTNKKWGSNQFLRDTRTPLLINLKLLNLFTNLLLRHYHFIF